MEHKKIIFLLSRFLDGGIDTVLTAYLTALAKMPNTSITLAIALKMDELEVYLERIPKSVKVVYLVDEPALTRYKKHKIKHPLPFYQSLFDELLLNPIRRWRMQQRLKKLAQGADTIVDFDCCQYRFLKGIKACKVGYFHFALGKELNRDPKRFKRLRHHIQIYDRFVTISQEMFQEAHKLFPEYADRLRMIYNALDVDLLYKRANEPTEDKRIEGRFLLSVTRLEETQKDVTTLIKAYHHLRQTYHHALPLYIIGQGKSQRALEALTKELGEEANIQFLGFMPNPLPWVKGCEVFVHSAKFEGLPTNLIEALLLDKMIVATDCPSGPKEILNHGKAGLLTPVGDAEALAAALHKAMTDKELQKRIAMGRQEHRKNFTFEVTLQKFLAL